VGVAILLVAVGAVLVLRGRLRGRKAKGAALAVLLLVGGIGLGSISAPAPAQAADCSSSSGSSGGGSGGGGLVLSDKAYVYVLAAQLALCQPPSSLLCAGVGWLVGMAWRAEVLPPRIQNWRVPEWVWKQGQRRGAARRQVGAAVDEVNDPATPARPLGTQILDTFRGTF